ncbi:hypothetical protein CDD83_11131 [Cordyceps sp. RAO-2017]|nr:hypothetical protein CDD83_11131 [Cordyceps sp. RAO-2017]
MPDRSAAFPAPDSIIYNPPASEASPIHTPFLFLPHDDPRRQAMQAMRDAASGSPPPSEPALPPAMRYRRRDPRYNLGREHLPEIRRLREEDPIEWSVQRLAAKFDCSPIFIQMVAPASPDHLKWLREKLERKKARWGPMKRQAREERKQRAEMLYRGEL